MWTESIMGKFCDLGRESREWPGEKQVLQGRGGHKQAEWVRADLLSHRYNLEPTSMLGGQGETEEKGRPLQIDRQQVP